MSARLAEPCRENPLTFTNAEDPIRYRNTEKPLAHLCQRDLFLGFFFDGTNNNKYRDLPKDGASNVARLFEAFIGLPAMSTPTYGGEPNRPLKVASVEGRDFPFYRKVYVPGLGTAFPEIRDAASGRQKTAGLAFAYLGSTRIAWALAQILNQVHAMFTGQDWIKPDELTRRLGNLQGESFEQVSASHFATFLREQHRAMTEALAVFVANKPRPRQLRLSAFGFSRGAAQARAFANELERLFGRQIAGIPLRFDMLGLFDTVASVGAAHLGVVTDGHMSWADGENLVIPPSVQRCVHLVAAHEVRMCFPLDSVCQNESLPPNCKEVVYPGVHSDVGGGYTPWDQGRSPTDADKVSQIALAQMYREARMAGVPLVSEEEMTGSTAKLFKISDSLKADFNAYIERTRSGRSDPSRNIGQLALMFPSETQPPQPLGALMHAQYAHYLAWRKYRISDIHQLPGLLQSKASSAVQDRYDIWQTNEDLKKELREDSLVSSATGKGDDLAAARQLWKAAKLSAEQDRALLRMFDLYVHDSRAWFKFSGEKDDEWFGSTSPSGNNYPSLKAQVRPRKTARREVLRGRVDQLSRTAADRTRIDYASTLAELSEAKRELAKIDAELALYDQWGDTLQANGDPIREMWNVAGYLRWRTLYTTADSRRDAWRLRQYDMCVLNNETRAAAFRGATNELARLHQEQAKILNTFISESTRIRDQIKVLGEAQRLRDFDDAIVRVLTQIARPMGDQNAQVQARIDELQRQLGTPCDAPKTYQEPPVSTTPR